MTGDCICISELYFHYVLSINISKANPDMDKICEQQQNETELVLTAAYSLGFFPPINQIKKVSKSFLWYIMQGVCKIVVPNKVYKMPCENFNKR